MRMNIAAALTAGTILVSLAGCSAAPESTPTSEMTIQTEETTTVTEAEISMTLKIGEREVQVT